MNSLSTKYRAFFWVPNAAQYFVNRDHFMENRISGNRRISFFCGCGERTAAGQLNSGFQIRGFFFSREAPYLQKIPPLSKAHVLAHPGAGPPKIRSSKGSSK